MSHKKNLLSNYYSTIKKQVYSFKHLTSITFLFDNFRSLIYSFCYGFALIMNMNSIILMEKKIISIEFWTCMLSVLCSSSIALYLLILMINDWFKKNINKTSFLPKVISNYENHISSVISVINYLS